MEAAPQQQPRDWAIFWSSLFFVLGFSSVFSLVGVLLQTALSGVSYSVQEWLGRIGGVVIILFGLFLLNIFRINLPSLGLAGMRRFRSQYATAFVFGAAFAVGWTPCVSAALGAILTLATIEPSSAFALLFTYTLGIGIPFLVVGLFTERTRAFIQKAGRWLMYGQYVFGVVLIILGVLIFVGELNRVANVKIIADILGQLNLISTAGGDIRSLNLVNLGVALFAGFGSFLSPCILPIVPGFLSYLASASLTSSTKPHDP